RYQPTYPRVGSGWISTLRRRLERFPRIPPVRALAEELSAAQEREERGEPAHWGDMIVRLMRVAVQQNTVLEERNARDKDAALAALAALREDVQAIVRREGGRRGARIAAAVGQRFDQAAFPFLGDRLVPRIAVTGGAGPINLETGLRKPRPWAQEDKLALIARGYGLLDEQLRERAVA